MTNVITLPNIGYRRNQVQSKSVLHKHDRHPAVKRLCSITMDRLVEAKTYNFNNAIFKHSMPLVDLGDNIA